MSFWDSIRLASRAISKNRFRASLTIFGIIIGIAAVTAMVSLGESTSIVVEKQIETLGTNMLAIIPGNMQRGGLQISASGSLTVDDYRAVRNECPTVHAATPIVATSGYVVYLNNNWPSKSIIGAGTEYPIVRSWNMKAGSFFTDGDIAAAAKVCVMGTSVVQELFQGEDPIDKTIRIKNVPFRVLGVLEEKGANMFGQDYDDLIIIPYTTAARRMRKSQMGNEVDVILTITATPALTGQARTEIERLLRERHRVGETGIPDFRVESTTEIALMLKLIMATITLMLTTIAAISLVVGGVGVMNIMLVSVAERTREIGIRMAVGARARDILRQFLLEAILLSCMGGIIGVLLGIGSSLALMQFINWYSDSVDWPAVVSLEAAGVGVLVAVAVGVFFGYYPALRASWLDPIDSLRYE